MRLSNPGSVTSPLPSEIRRQPPPCRQLFGRDSGCSLDGMARHAERRRKIDRRLREQRERESHQPVGAHLQQDAGQNTEPAVGASTCASGSQVWNGNSGTLMANASANARKKQSCSWRGTSSVVQLQQIEAVTPVAV